MKKITFIAIICMTLFSINGFAQMGGGYGGYGGGYGRMGGGYGRGMGMPSGPETQPKRELDINFTGATGYFNIDSEEAIKKIRVKNDPTKEEAISSTISNFISECQGLVDDHRADFDTLEFAKESIEAAEGDMNALRDIMKSVRVSNSNLRPILIEKHKALNAQMTEILSKKENKRWAKFYKGICKDNKFDPEAKQPKIAPKSAPAEK